MNREDQKLLSSCGQVGLTIPSVLKSQKPFLSFDLLKMEALIIDEMTNHRLSNVICMLLDCMSILKMLFKPSLKGACFPLKPDCLQGCILIALFYKRLRSYH